MLAYLTDVFGHLNSMTLSLQGRDKVVSDVKDKLAGLTARMGVWLAPIKTESATSLPLLEKINRIDLRDIIKLSSESTLKSSLLSAIIFLRQHVACFMVQRPV